MKTFPLEDLLRELWVQYSGGSRRKQRKHYEELLRKAYSKIHFNPNLKVLKDTVEYVLNKLHTNVVHVFCTILLDEGFKSKGTLNKLVVTIKE